MKMAEQTIFRLLLLLINAAAVVGAETAESQITSGFMDRDFLTRKAARIDTSNDTNVFALPKQLRLVTTSQFTCTGSISGFYVGAKVQSSGSLYPRAEVWRTAEDDRRRKRRDDEGYALRYSVELKPTFTDFLSATGTYRYMLPSEPLSFRTNDIFAVYQPSPSDSLVTLHYTNMSQSFQSVSLTRTTRSSFVSKGSSRSDVVNNQHLLIQPISGELNKLLY